ncbi:hypothetical protein B5G11_12600 [Drancourtella sp. An57]|uniref:hypothetical protein n=1 Tax=Drancourtella sp. An57 TaxID=1965647 RepID=UPI000B3677F6|nr:hypothetical protein [Drancourtella sp. An57]OUN68598.1 hypothetical protein B5G11_12600 [Drancourtella sp. An57]
MADQKINALPTKTAPITGDKCLMSGAAEEYLIDYDKLATAILNKLTSKTFTLDQGTKTLIAAVNELNSKSFSVSNIATDVSQLDDIEETTVSYVSGALIEEKSVYGFAITIAYGSVVSQIVFGSFSGSSSIAVRGKSGSPISWKSWKIL